MISINPNSRGEQGGGKETKKSARSDFVELSDQSLFIGRIETDSQVHFNGFRIVEFLSQNPNSPKFKHFL